MFNYSYKGDLTNASVTSLPVTQNGPYLPKCNFTKSRVFLTQCFSFKCCSKNVGAYMPLPA